MADGKSVKVVVEVISASQNKDASKKILNDLEKESVATNRRIAQDRANLAKQVEKESAKEAKSFIDNFIKVGQKFADIENEREKQAEKTAKEIERVEKKAATERERTEKQLQKEVEASRRKTESAHKQNQSALEKIERQSLSERNNAQRKAADEFLKSLKDVEDETSNTMSRIGSYASAAASGFVLVGTAIVAVGGTLFKLAKDASDFGSTIFDASTQTGLTAETLSALKVAAETSGSSLENVTGSVSKFSKLVGEAAEGSDSAKASLIRLGLDPKTAINSLDDSLSKVFKRIQEAENPIVKTKLATEAFGKSGAALIPIIASFDGDMQKLIKTAKELGLTLTDEDAKAADDFGDTLDVLKMQSGAAANEFARGFMPAITSAMSEISGSLKGNKSVWREWGEEVGNIILRLTRGSKVVLAVLKDIATGNFAGTNTAIALQQNADAYANDQRQQGIQNTLNDPNRPDWLKQQDAGIDRLGKSNSSAIDLEDQVKAADERRKKREEAFKKDLTARKAQNNTVLQNNRDTFNDLQKMNEEQFIKGEKTAEQFKNQALSNISVYQQNAKSILENTFSLDKIGQSGEALKSLQMQLNQDLIKLDRDVAAEKADTEKTIADNTKKVVEERIKLYNEEYDFRIQKNNESIAAEIANQEHLAAIGQRTEKDLLAFTNAQKLAGLNYEKSILEERLQQVKGNAEEELKIKRQLQLLKIRIEKQGFENAKEVAEFFKKQSEDEAETAKKIADQQKEILDKQKDAEEKALKESQDRYAKLRDTVQGFFRDALDLNFKNIWENAFGYVKDFVAKALAELALLKIFNIGNPNGQAQSGGFNLGGLFGGNQGGGIFNLIGGGNSGGITGLIRNIPFLGGLFGGGGAAGAVSSAGSAVAGIGTSATAGIGGAMSAGIGSALGGLGGLLGIGGATAGTAAAGTGAAAGASAAGSGGLLSSMGALFTNPWTAVIAGSALGAFGLYKLFSRGKDLKKIKSAAMSEFSVDVKDKSLLKTLRSTAAGYGIKVKDDASAREAVKIEENQEALRDYAERTGQKTDKFDQAFRRDSEWEGNQFSTGLSSSFSSGGASGSTVRSASNNSRPQGLMSVLSDLQATVQMLNDKIQPIDAKTVVAMGADGASAEITNAIGNEFNNNPNSRDSFARNFSYV